MDQHGYLFMWGRGQQPHDAYKASKHGYDATYVHQNVEIGSNSWSS